MEVAGGGGGGGRLCSCRYTVTSGITSALRSAAMRAILLFHYCEGRSHETVSTDHNFCRERRAEADSNRGPSAYQPNALPPGQTGSILRVRTVSGYLYTRHGHPTDHGAAQITYYDCGDHLLLWSDRNHRVDYFVTLRRVSSEKKRKKEEFWITAVWRPLTQTCRWSWPQWLPGAGHSSLWWFSAGMSTAGTGFCSVSGCENCWLCLRRWRVGGRGGACS